MDPDKPGLFDLPYSFGSTLFLGIVLAVSIVAGELVMVAVSFLLLAILGGLMYRARAIKRAEN